MNKVALITGVADRMGKAMAQQLKEENYQVVITDINKEKGLETLKEQGATFIYVDLALQEE